MMAISRSTLNDNDNGELEHLLSTHGCVSLSLSHTISISSASSIVIYRLTSSPNNNYPQNVCKWFSIMSLTCLPPWPSLSPSRELSNISFTLLMISHIYNALSVFMFSKCKCPDIVRTIACLNQLLAWPGRDTQSPRPASTSENYL